MGSNEGISATLGNMIASLSTLKELTLKIDQPWIPFHEQGKAFSLLRQLPPSLEKLTIIYTGDCTTYDWSVLLQNLPRLTHFKLKRELQYHRDTVGNLLTSLLEPKYCHLETIDLDLVPIILSKTDLWLIFSNIPTSLMCLRLWLYKYLDHETAATLNNDNNVSGY